MQRQQATPWLATILKVKKMLNKDLIVAAGFKVFGEKIVAGDFGSSGNATLCAQKLIELVVKQCADAADMAPETEGKSAGDYVVLKMGFEQKEGAAKFCDNKEEN